MKLLLLNYEYSPLGGGAGIATKYLLREFAKYPDLEIDLVTSSLDRARDERVSDKVRVHCLDIGKKNKNRLFQSEKDLLVYSVKAYFYSRALIKKNKYDFVHAFFGVPCGFIALLLGAKYMISLRGSDVPFHNPRFRFLDRFVFSWLSKIIWRRAALVVANSENLTKEALKINSGVDMKLIYNGVDIDIYKPDEAHLQREDNKLRFMFAGRLSPVKGVDLLIDAFESVYIRHPGADIELWIVGDGKLAGELRCQASQKKSSGKIKFYGDVQESMMPDLYRQCDIFVLPSLSEGMPLTIVEAMASGQGIICTDNELLGKLVRNGLNGYLVKPGDVSELAGMMSKYISGGKGLAVKHGRISREAAKEYDWARMAGKYVECYRSVINGKDSRLRHD